MLRGATHKVPDICSIPSTVHVYVLACPLFDLSTAEGYLEIDTIFVSTVRF